MLLIYAFNILEQADCQYTFFRQKFLFKESPATMWIYQHNPLSLLPESSAPLLLPQHLKQQQSTCVLGGPVHRCTHLSPAMLPGDSLEWALIAAEVRVCEKKSRHLQVVRQVFKTTTLEAPRRSTFSRFFCGYHSAFSHWSLQCCFSHLCLGFCFERM